MATVQPKLDTSEMQAQAAPLHAKILNSVDEADILRELNKYRLAGGRRTYRLVSHWRAYLLSFLLNVHSTADLWRRLGENPAFRLMCGYGSGTLPNARTLNRFIKRLTAHPDLVAECLDPFVDDLHDRWPDLGNIVAVDSTTVRTHSNPRSKSDLEASWAVKNSAQSKSGKDAVWSYKLHMAVDATYSIPLMCLVTTGSRNDTQELRNLLDMTGEVFPWFKPDYVLADRGYSSKANHKAVMDRGGILISPARRKSVTKKGASPLYEGIYTEKGVPTCLGGLEMEHVMSDSEKGHLYRCPMEGCRFKGRKAAAFCNDEYWVSPEEQASNPYLFSPLRQRSEEWNALYDMRQSVERVFKSVKQSRRLEFHAVRGMAHVRLHALMSILAYTATRWVQLEEGMDESSWMVRRAA